MCFQLVDTTVELANKVGAAEIISRIVDDLKDEAEQYRKMVMETIEKIMGNLGAADIDHKLEEQLIDGILYAFQEQTTEVRSSAGLRPLLLTKGRFLKSMLCCCLCAGFCNAEWFRYSSERSREACETIPASDLRYGAVASQQQVGQSPSAGGGSHLTHSGGDENLSGGELCRDCITARRFDSTHPLMLSVATGEADGSPGCGSVRIPGRRVP